MRISNNVLAVFAIALILSSVFGTVAVFFTAERLETGYGSKVTGRASATGLVQFTVVTPITDINLSAYLHQDNSTVVLTWANMSQDNVSIFITNNISEGFNYGNPNVTGLTGFSWSDPNAYKVQQRYYKAGVWNNDVFTLIDSTMGKFDIPIYHSTQIPGEVEFNTISLPLRPSNLSLNNIFRWSENGDSIGTYNPFKAPDPGFDSSLYFSGLGWWGDIVEINVTKTYWLGLVDTAYNLTVVGEVPTEHIKVHLYRSTQIPTEVEFNTVGWHSVYKRCNMTAVLGPGSANVTDGDVIAVYNPFKTPDPGFDSSIYFSGLGWWGEITCLEPGKGYTFGIVQNEYDWEYDPEP